MIQKSYEETNIGKLYLIPTPIGNFDDITLRGIKMLEFVDIIFAEDTRETLKLLKKFNINKQIESCHKYSELKNRNKIINLLLDGKNIGYVTDRGTPLISDPGNIIVDEAIKSNVDVIALPGANALLPALNMSGISNEKFLFYGFLNSKKSFAKKELIKLKKIEYTIIFYEAPHRINETLKLLYQVLGNRKVAIVREISKLYEEIIRENLLNIINKNINFKGEFVIVVEGYSEKNNIIDYSIYVKKLLKKGYTKRDAIKEIADQYNISKNELYELCKEL